MPSKEKPSKGQFPVLPGDLQGSAFDAAAAGRRAAGRGCAWLCLHWIAVRTESKLADLCSCFPSPQQLEKLLSCGGKGSELSWAVCVGEQASLRERHWRSHIWKRTFSLLTLPGGCAQNCLHHADAFPLQRFSSKWS